MHDDDYSVCPHCGADVASQANFCRECGSDVDTGWSEYAEYGGLDLPDEAEDMYEEQAARAAPTLWQQIVVATAILLLLFFFYWAFCP
jgi:uncharacterized membrane protein YvbJ